MKADNELRRLACHVTGHHVPAKLTSADKNVRPVYLCQNCGKELTRKEWLDYFSEKDE